MCILYFASLGRETTCVYRFLSIFNIHIRICVGNCVRQMCVVADWDRDPCRAVEGGSDSGPDTD